MELTHGKYFSITEPKDVNTVIYQIKETEKELIDENSPKFTLERLKCRQELVGQNRRKTFFVDAPKNDGNQLVILSFGQDRVVVNMGIKEIEQEKYDKMMEKAGIKALKRAVELGAFTHEKLESWLK